MAFLMLGCPEWSDIMELKTKGPCCNLCHGIGHACLKTRKVGDTNYAVCCLIANICLKRLAEKDAT